MTPAFRCPRCSRRFEAEDEWQGEPIQCPSCAVNLVPEGARSAVGFDFVTLTCPCCGGKLEVTRDMERFACAHCGAEHLVLRRGGTISLEPVMEGIRQVKNTVDRTAAELAIVRLEKEIAELNSTMGTALTIPVFGALAITVAVTIPLAVPSGRFLPVVFLGTLFGSAALLYALPPTKRRRRLALELNRMQAELAENRRIVGDRTGPV